MRMVRLDLIPERPSTGRTGSDVVVEHEFPGMWTKPNFVNLPQPLELDPRVDQIIGEHTTFGEKRLIVLQSSQRVFRDDGT